MNIVYYGGHHWDNGPWFRKQQIASRLSAMGHNVYYIEDSIAALRKTKIHKNKYLKTQIYKVNDNLKIIIPSTFFLFPRKYLPRHIYNLKLLRDINKFLKKDGVRDYILFFNRIEFSTVLNKVNAIKIVDICDDIPYYAKIEGDESAFRNMNKFLETALHNSDLGIVSAIKLKEKYQHLINKKLVVIPNGHSINFVKTETTGTDLENIKRPIIGFLGTLFKFTDHNLLKFIIEKRQNYNFVFVGVVETNFPIALIKNYPNVHLLGKVKKEQVPKIINSFDVCINPFNRHEVNDSVNPVKVFEYLALKKQVISTEMYSLRKEKLGAYIHFANSKEEFLEVLDRIVNASNYKNLIPDSVISEYHWDSLFKKLVSEINKSLNISL